MTAQEKAKELIYSYYQLVADSSYPKELAKQCALICVDRIIKANNNDLYVDSSLIEYTSDSRWIYDKFMKYWQEVKQAIENHG